MNIKTKMQEFTKKFDIELLNYLDRKIEESKTLNKEAVKNLLEVKRIIKNGGKRVRPFLVYYSYKLCGGNNYKQAISLGISLELLHAFALIHDDIIDRSCIRRGQPTIQSQYQNEYKNNNTNNWEHNGTSAAILAGDYAYHLARENLEMTTVEVRKIFNKMEFELIGGQLDDTLGTGMAKLEELNEAVIIKMLKNKSGNYSIQKPLMMGAILAKANKEQIDTLENAGEKIGLVFQLVDDILDVFGDSDKTGKTFGSDVIEKKRTLMIYKTWQVCTKEDRIKMEEIYDNKNCVTKDDIIWIQTKIKETETLASIRNYCNFLTSESIQELEEKFGNEKDLKIITQFANYLLNREL